jgi:hypothetical protein
MFEWFKNRQVIHIKVVTDRTPDTTEKEQDQSCPKEPFAGLRLHRYSKPFVLGSISRIRSSLEQAPRNARANALKIASIL